MTQQDRNVRDLVFFPGDNFFTLKSKMDKFVKEKNKKITQN